MIESLKGRLLSARTRDMTVVVVASTVRIRRMVLTATTQPPWSFGVIGRSGGRRSSVLVDIAQVEWLVQRGIFHYAVDMARPNLEYKESYSRYSRLMLANCRPTSGFALCVIDRVAIFHLIPDPKGTLRCN